MKFWVGRPAKAAPLRGMSMLVAEIARIKYFRTDAGEGAEFERALYSIKMQVIIGFYQRKVLKEAKL